MKRFKTILIIMALFNALMLVAYAGDDPAQFTETQLALVINFLIPVFAQVSKIYREKLGRKLSSTTVNWIVFAAGVVMAFVWGGAVDYLEAIAFPSLDFSDPATLFADVVEFANDIFKAGTAVIGRVVGYYLILKPLVFAKVTVLKTKKMIKG